MKHRFYREIRLLIAVISGGLLYAVWCMQTNLYIPCIFNKATNLECPSCGVTRMVMAVLNGEFTLGFYCNPVLFCMVPVLLYLLGKSEYTYIRYASRKLTKFDQIAACACIGVLIVYGVIRNII